MPRGGVSRPRSGIQRRIDGTSPLLVVIQQSRLSFPPYETISKRSLNTLHDGLGLPHLLDLTIGRYLSSRRFPVVAISLCLDPRLSIYGSKYGPKRRFNTETSVLRSCMLLMSGGLPFHLAQPTKLATQLEATRRHRNVRRCAYELYILSSDSRYRSRSIRTGRLQ